MATAVVAEAVASVEAVVAATTEAEAVEVVAAATAVVVVAMKIVAMIATIAVAAEAATAVTAGVEATTWVAVAGDPAVTDSRNLSTVTRTVVADMVAVEASEVAAAAMTT